MGKEFADMDIHQLDWVEDNRKVKAFFIYESSVWSDGGAAQRSLIQGSHSPWSSSSNGGSYHSLLSLEASIAREDVDEGRR